MQTMEFVKEWLKKGFSVNKTHNGFKVTRINTIRGARGIYDPRYFNVGLNGEIVRLHDFRVIDYVKGA